MTGVKQGKVGTGSGEASHCLTEDHIALIEERTGLKGIVKGTLNLRLEEPYDRPHTCPDAELSREEFHGFERVWFMRCRAKGIRCLVMRAENHVERPSDLHNTAHLELMSDRCLRKALEVEDGDTVSVEVEGGDAWWDVPSPEMS